MRTLLLYFLVIWTLGVSFAQDCPKNHEAALTDKRLKWTLTLDDDEKLDLEFLTEEPAGLFLVAEKATLDIKMGLKPSNIILTEVTLETKLVKTVKIFDQSDTLPILNEPSWQESKFSFNKKNVESIKIEVESTSAEMKIRNVVVRACIPVQWCEWGPWGDCEVSCGEGVRERDRECKCSNPDLLFECDGSPKKTEICKGPCCKKPPKIGPWSDWGRCTVSCGGGTQRRTRQCIPDACPDGTDCPEKKSETRACNEQCCKKPPSIGQWREWDTCTVTCGGGTQRRTRRCIPDACPDGTDCPENKSETQACNEQCCIGESKWSTWLEWEDCSLTCGDGVRSRDRICEKDPDCPVPGPPNCPGNNIQTENCNLGCCEVPPFWSDWNPWDPCPVTCGGGVQERKRRCIDDPDCPQVGGKCPGRGTDSRICNDECCPVAPEWSKWKKWSKCNVSCGTGIQTRKRKCKKDKICPLVGGKCPGKKKQTQTCEGPCCEERIDFDNRDDVTVSITGGLKTRDGTHILDGSASAFENILLKNIDGTERVEITFKSGSRHIIQVGVETFLAGKVILEADPGIWEDENSVDPTKGDFSPSVFDAPGGQINNQDQITLRFKYPTGEIAVKSLYLIVCV